jgi:hypothetical protein
MQVFVCTGAEAIKTILLQWVMSDPVLAGNCLCSVVFGLHYSLKCSPPSVCIYFLCPNGLAMECTKLLKISLKQISVFWRMGGIAGCSCAIVHILFHPHVLPSWPGTHFCNLDLNLSALNWKSETTFILIVSTQHLNLKENPPLCCLVENTEAHCLFPN